jgi:endonuclease YncB( thermonuclease family)
LRLVLGKRGLKRCIAFLLLLAAGATGGVALKGRVVSVADGDSLSVFAGVEGKKSIRLYGIDCPELRQKGGGDARTFTRSLAFLEEVRLDVLDTDAYGRSVAVVTLPDGRILNEELLKSGQAWVYGAYCAIPRCAYWRGLEKQARIQKRGLWNDARPVPPWTWRKRNR